MFLFRVSGEEEEGGVVGVSRWRDGGAVEGDDGAVTEAGAFAEGGGCYGGGC